MSKFLEILQNLKKRFLNYIFSLWNLWDTNFRPFHSISNGLSRDNELLEKVANFRKVYFFQNDTFCSVSPRVINRPRRWQILHILLAAPLFLDFWGFWKNLNKIFQGTLLSSHKWKITLRGTVLDHVHPVENFLSWGLHSTL